MKKSCIHVHKFNSFSLDFWCKKIFTEESKHIPNEVNAQLVSLRSPLSLQSFCNPVRQDSMLLLFLKCSQKSPKCVCVYIYIYIYIPPSHFQGQSRVVRFHPSKLFLVLLIIIICDPDNFKTKCSSNPYFGEDSYTEET